MSALLTAAEIEAAAKTKGLSIAQLCLKAGVAHSTFTRWRAAKAGLGLETYGRLVAAIEGTEFQVRQRQRTEPIVTPTHPDHADAAA